MNVRCRLHRDVAVLVRDRIRRDEGPGTGAQPSFAQRSHHVAIPKRSVDVVKIAEAQRINLRIIDANSLGIALDETTSETDLADLLQIIRVLKNYDCFKEPQMELFKAKRRRGGR